jgi:DNA-binding CsgD family transcriptional regulator
MSTVDSLFIRIAHANYCRPPFADDADCPADLSTEELTERERDILLMTSLGLCNKVISRRMNISVRTVENHRSSLRRKLGTGTFSRMEAMVQVMLGMSSTRIAELLNIDLKTADSQLLSLRSALN